MKVEEEKRYVDLYILYVHINDRSNEMTKILIIKGV